jgi:hypothetical protein
MIFTIGPDKRLLYELTQLAMNELDQKIDLLHHKVTTTEDLEVFHSKIFPCMKHWAFKNQSDFYADMWIDAVEKGLHQISTWNHIKGLLDIADPTEYFYSIKECGDVTMPFECTFDFISNKYTYIDPSQTVVHDDKSNLKTHDPDHNSNVSSPVAYISIQPSVTPQTTNMAAQHNLYVPDFEEDPILTDDDHDTIPTIDNDLPWQPYHPEHNFSYVHSVVFHYITQWATLKPSKSHSFYPKLQRFKYAGLKHIMTWTEVCDNPLSSGCDPAQGD